MNRITSILSIFSFVIALLLAHATSVEAQKKEGVPAQAWSLKGNRGTNPETDFLGTADATELRIGTNGKASIFIHADGSVQIGSEDNQIGLDVYGNLWVSGSVTGVRGSYFGGDTNYHATDSVGLLQFYGTGNFGVRAGRYVYRALDGGGALTGMGLRNAASGNSLELTDGAMTTVLSMDYATGDLTTEGSANISDSLIAGDGRIAGSLAVADSLVAGNARIAGTLGVGGPNTDPTNYALFVNGRLRSAGINELSDRRMKNDVETIDGALETVLGLRGVSYEWRQDEFPELNLQSGTQIGLIAQEVEEVVPEVVHTDVNGVKSVEYAHLVAVLIEAVKEQQQLIQEQAQVIAEVRSELSGLREIASAE